MSTDLFNVTYNGIYSLSSDGEHGAGPYVDLDKITGAEKLGEIALENWENVGLLVNTLVDQKGMKIIVHECLIKDSYWSSKYTSQGRQRGTPPSSSRSATAASGPPSRQR